MIHASEINYERSIQTGWLSFSGSMRHYRLSAIMHGFDRVAFVISMLAILVYIFLVVFVEANYKNPNDKVVSILLLIILPYILYSVYRKIAENKLLRIPTHLSPASSAALIKALLKKRGADEVHGNSHCVIAREESSLAFNGKPYIQTIILITESSIYLNVRRNNPRVNLPVLFAHLFLQAAIKKAIKNSGKN